MKESFTKNIRISLNQFLKASAILCLVLFSISLFEKFRKRGRFHTLNDFYENELKRRFSTGVQEISFEEFLDSSELYLSGEYISDKILSSLKEMKNLSILYLSEGEVSHQGLKSVSQINKLARLELSHVNLSDSGLRYLSGLENLTSLSVIYSEITNKALIQIGRIKNLTHLDFHDAIFVKDSSLKPLCKLKKLTHLDLSYTNIWWGITAISDISSLTHLNFQGAEIGSFHTLYYFEELNHLKELNLLETSIERAEVIPLRKRFPSLIILVEDNDIPRERWRWHLPVEGE